MISVREERAEDRDAIRRVEEAAFGRAEEADIVDALRGDEAWALSLVAELDGEIVGHLLFSRGDRAMTLGPLAVLPERQRSGVLLRMRRCGYGLVREVRGCPLRDHINGHERPRSRSSNTGVCVQCR